MSWQAYVDTNLVGSGMVTAAGIYDLQGNPWAYSAGFAVRPPPSPHPPTSLSTSPARPAPAPPLPRKCGSNAAALAGVPRAVLSPLATSRSPRHRAAALVQAQVAEVAAVSAHFAAPSGLAATGATVAGVKYMFVRGEENAEIYVKKGAEGVVFYRCNTCIIVGYHNDKIQPGQCSTTVAKLGDFLKESSI